MGRIGLFGGTFDPPHLGHLVLASLAADALTLDAVWFVLAASPPHKQHQPLAPVDHRLAMLGLALADNSLFQVSRIDIDRPGPHYTVDMVALAQAEHPDDDFYFLMGGDSLRDLPTWHQADQLLMLCPLVVMRRLGAAVDVAALESALPGIGGRVTFLEGPEVVLSATLIGEWVQAGRSIRYLVPETVRLYIEQHQLYRAGH